MFFSKKASAPTLDPARMPRHIAIIMDGNGRWAQKRHLPRSSGHAAGAETLRSIAACAKRLSIPYLTVYAFSTENWKRSEEEVSAIMGLLKNYLLEVLRDLDKNQFHTAFWGDLSPLSPELRELCMEAQEASAKYQDSQVNICLNYGARDEILRAARAFAADCLSGAAKAEQLTESGFEAYLYSHGVPDPDLIIRPSGEERLSNFLLWQAAYAELYYTDILWPDFRDEDLIEAIAAYQHRARRFGGV